MSFSTVTFAASALALLSSVSAHGTVSGIVAGGKYYTGYSPNFQYANPIPVVAGWSIPKDQDNGFIAPSKFQDPDIICHVGATNAGTSIPVAAGSTVELEWTVWPESHHGPVIDYLASCNGKCETVDKTTLEFFKIGEAGLLDDANVPGTWASDKLIANNNTWVATIPADIAPGNYVLRHEIIALHSAGTVDGAQNYPQCINLVVSGSGSAKPAGTVGTKLYTDKDPGILVNIYQTLASYVIPGPALYKSGAPPTAPETSAAAPETSAAAPETSAAASETSAAAPAVTAAPTTTASPIIAVPIQTEDETVSVTVTATRTATAGQPAETACNAATATVTVTTAGAGATVTEQATVTVTAPATTVTVTATASRKAVPSGATLDDILNWLGNSIKNAAGGNGRRHARAVARV